MEYDQISREHKLQILQQHLGNLELEHYKQVVAEELAAKMAAKLDSQEAGKAVIEAQSMQEDLETGIETLRSLIAELQSD